MNDGELSVARSTPDSRNPATALAPPDRRLCRAIAGALIRELRAWEPGYETRHDLLFTLRDPDATNNAEAIERWVEHRVVAALAASHTAGEVMDLVSWQFREALAPYGLTQR